MNNFLSKKHITITIVLFIVLLYSNVNSLFASTENTNPSSDTQGYELDISYGFHQSEWADIETLFSWLMGKLS